MVLECENAKYLTVLMVLASGCSRAIEILAENQQYKRSHVPERGGRYIRGDGPSRVCKGTGAAVPSVGQKRCQPTFSGSSLNSNYQTQH